MDNSGIAVGSIIGAAAVVMIVVLFVAPPESIKQNEIIDKTQISVKEEEQKTIERKKAEQKAKDEENQTKLF